MAKVPKNTNKQWTAKEKAQLQKLADQNTPTRVIALKMDRSASAIYSKASQEDISLKPTNQSPYGTKKKK